MIIVCFIDVINPVDFLLKNGLTIKKGIQTSHTFSATQQKEAI